MIKTPTKGPKQRENPLLLGFKLICKLLGLSRCPRHSLTHYFSWIDFSATGRLKSVMTLSKPGYFRIQAFTAFPMAQMKRKVVIRLKAKVSWTIKAVACGFRAIQRPAEAEEVPRLRWAGPPLGTDVTNSSEGHTSSSVWTWTLCFVRRKQTLSNKGPTHLQCLLSAQFPFQEDGRIDQTPSCRPPISILTTLHNS